MENGEIDMQYYNFVNFLTSKEIILLNIRANDLNFSGITHIM